MRDDFPVIIAWVRDYALFFLQTALFAEQNTLGSCPIDTFLFKQQIQLQSEMQI